MRTTQTEQKPVYGIADFKIINKILDNILKESSNRLFFWYESRKLAARLEQSAVKTVKIIKWLPK